VEGEPPRSPLIEGGAGLLGREGRRNGCGHVDGEVVQAARGADTGKPDTCEDPKPIGHEHKYNSVPTDRLTNV
jgi:hypothetical protein